MMTEMMMMMMNIRSWAKRGRGSIKAGRGGVKKEGGEEGIGCT
jgi:hypothetical protein